MPQMAPMWWTSLFMMFIMSFLMTMTMIYFFNIYSMSKKNIKKMKNKEKLNWKW